MTKFIVAKFGGSNLKNHHDYSRLVKVVKSYNQPLIMVVSAFHGRTNKLVSILDKALTSKQDADDFIGHLLSAQIKLIHDNIAPGKLRGDTEAVITSRIGTLHDILTTIHASGEVTEATHDLVLSYGERLSSLVTSRVLISKGFDTRGILPEELGLITDGHFGFASVDFKKSVVNINKRLSGKMIYVVPGFYGISAEGQVTLFGRGGSDYTAAALARCVGASSLDVWKDVDGFLTADPGIVQDVRRIAKLIMPESIQSYIYEKPFPLELGGVLPGLTIGYHTYGRLNEQKDNVIWICHAFTANSAPHEWWPGLVGPGKLYDPANHFIVCANILGSCYGTTGPLSINPITGRPWYREFPKITIRDMVSAHDLLRQQLGIAGIHTLIGGSLGGQQAMEWAIKKPGLSENLILLATGAVLTPWAIALNQSQRMSIEADCTYYEGWPGGGEAGLKAARSIALLSYRNCQTYNQSQMETDPNKTGRFKAATYQEYQGEKLVKRFNAWSYHLLTRAMDTHNVARGRESIAKALGRISARTLAVGISSDILFPAGDMKDFARHINSSRYVEITSDYGHDGFLIEHTQLTNIILQFYKTKKYESAT
jgi:homoserine O-acetyltransferase